MLQSKKPDDYVIATGKNYSVKQFINESIKVLKLKTKWVGKGLNEKLINTETNKAIIVIDKKFFRPTEVNILKGNYQKAKKEFGFDASDNLTLTENAIPGSFRTAANLDLEKGKT